MKRNFTGLLLVLMFMLSACAMTRNDEVRVADYPITHKAFDITFGLKTSISTTGITVEGYARNNRYFLVSNLELLVMLVDRSGKEKAVESFFFLPLELPMDDYAPFTLELKARPEPGDLLRFVYRYVGMNGRDGDISWMSSFDLPPEK